MIARPRKLTVAVLLGGTSPEREVSLASGRAVIQALNPKEYRVMIFDPAVDIPKLVSAAPRIDVALVMLHGGTGEDGTIQGLLDLLEIPYQCAGVLGCALAMDKPKSKIVYKAAGLPVARDVVLYRSTHKPVATLLETLSPPVVIKPASTGSSVGISIVHYKKHLAEALKQAFLLDNQVMVEQFIDGREMTVGVIGNAKLEALPVIEIKPGEGYSFFDYEAKYQPGATEEICPAPIHPNTARMLQRLAVRAHQALGLKGYSRTDFILTDKGPVLLETNTVPGMTATSLLPRAARAGGMDFPAFIRRLVKIALGEE